ncbi:MAG: hypothetical protein ABSH50_22415 [Bryobacteraceae bacterium]
MRSMASGAAFHCAFLHATQQAFLEAHELAFGYFTGVFRRLRYDNLGSAVKKILRGQRRDYRLLSRPRTHYADAAKRIAFYRAVLGNLQAMPGTTSVAAARAIQWRRRFGVVRHRRASVPFRRSRSARRHRFHQPGLFRRAEDPICKGRVSPISTGKIPSPWPWSTKPSPANTGRLKTRSESTAVAADWPHGRSSSASWAMSKMRISAAKMS